MATLPSVEGVFFLGNGLLEAIGGTLHAGPTGEILVGDKRWATTPGTMQGEITVGSPDEGGAEARVRVLVSPGYSGTLLLEEPLAYALGLHQFEIPGDVEFQSTDGQRVPIEGRRARARVTIPELDFDRVVEVQVVRERPWMVKRGRRAREVGLLFPRLKPAQIVTADALEGLPEGGYRTAGAEVHTAQDGFEHLEIQEGARRLVLGFKARGSGAVPVLPDVPILGELFRSAGGTLVPRALDFDPFTLHVLEVGTRAAGGPLGTPGGRDDRTGVARADRDPFRGGGRAHAGRRGRAHRLPAPRGRAGLDAQRCSCGRRTAGRPSTTWSWRRSCAPRRASDLSLGADGIVAGPGWTVALFDGPGEGDEATGTPAPERFAALIAAARLARGQGRGARPERRLGDRVVLRRAGPTCPGAWRSGCCSARRIRASRIRRFRLRVVDAGREGPTSRILLPRRRGPGGRDTAGTPSR